MSVPIEPSADVRAMANMVRQMFLALTEQGFTETQALVILGHMLGTAAVNGQGGTQ